MLRAAHPHVRSFDSLQIGEVIHTASLTVTEAHVVAFAGLTGDFHPLHMDEVTAANSPFHRRIAHGLLVLSLCNGLINQADLFDAFAILKVEYKLVAPVFIGDTIRVRSTLLEKRLTKRADRGIVVYAREVINQHDDVVQDGRTTFMAAVRTPTVDERTSLPS